jgi:hypothetical protein
MGENSPYLVTLLAKAQTAFECFNTLAQILVKFRHETTDHIVGRVARFFLVQNTKMGKTIPNYHKL